MDEPECIVDEYGTKQWHLNGRLHRTDGPAVEKTNSTKKWYFNGLLHRSDGPAVIQPDGSKFWFINGMPKPKPIISHNWKQQGF